MSQQLVHPTPVRAPSETACPAAITATLVYGIMAGRARVAVSCAQPIDLT